jgi:hypothetical protein
MGVFVCATNRLPGRHNPITLLGVDYIDIATALKVQGVFSNSSIAKSKNQYGTIKYRIWAGWSPEQAFGYELEPDRHKGDRPRIFYIDEVKYPSVEAALLGNYEQIKDPKLKKDTNRAIALICRFIVSPHARLSTFLQIVIFKNF